MVVLNGDEARSLMLRDDRRRRASE